jgi:hypothetical protein
MNTQNRQIEEQFFELLCYIHLPESQVILEHIEEAKAGVGEGEQYFSSALERIVSDLLAIIMHRKKQEDK